jgi:uncharacterized membrane protein YjfL (UPF0719 family)
MSVHAADLEENKMLIDHILTAGVYFVFSILLLLVGILAFRIFNIKIDIKDELVEKDNFAFAIVFASYIAGVIISIGGVFWGPSHGLVEDLIEISIYGSLAIILINISAYINDWFILRKIDAPKEILEDRNAGTAVVLGASSIATGLVVSSAVSGEGGSVLTALGFWVIGQLALILFSYLYQFFVPYDYLKEIEKDNVAVGLGFAGLLIAIAIIINQSMFGDFLGWENFIGSVAIDLMIGIVFLPLVRLLTDKVILPGKKLSYEVAGQEVPNIGAGLIEAITYIGSALLIVWAL